MQAAFDVRAALAYVRTALRHAHGQTKRGLVAFALPATPSVWVTGGAIMYAGAGLPSEP